MVIIRGSMSLITETLRGFEYVPETEIQALPQTRQSLMPSVIASSSHFELLESHMPLYQNALGNRLEYELMFNDYTCDPGRCRRLIPYQRYISRVRHGHFARAGRNDQHKGCYAILYDRVLRHQKMTMDKSNTLWNINLKVPSRNMGKS